MEYEYRYLFEETPLIVFKNGQPTKEEKESLIQAIEKMNNGFAVLINSCESSFVRLIYP